MGRSLWLVSVVAAALAAAPCDAFAVLHVDGDAPLGGDGTAWKTAYRFLQDALADAASSGGGVTEIRVAEGVYRPDRDETHAGGTGDRGATFQLLDSVLIAGGFAGLGAPDPDDRDLDLYRTTLSGDLAGDDGPPGSFTNSAENSYNVVTGSGTGPTAILDGVTITAGHADGPDDPGMLHLSRGGGMWNATGSPTIRNCRFEHNFARERGGGMYNFTGSSPEVSGCSFVGNVCAGSTHPAGGGMYNYGDSNPVVTDCLFSGNSALIGGGMVNNQGSHPTVTNCQFLGNFASYNGGGMVNSLGSNPTVIDCQFGGNSGVGMQNGYDSSPAVTGCLFIGNSAGGMSNGIASNPLVADCQFIDNQGGAGITNGLECSPTVTGCLFMGNSSAGHGGGMLNTYEAGPIVTNCQFLGNFASYNGGGMCNLIESHPQVADCTFTSNFAFASGGAIFTGSGEVAVTGCTFTDNEASSGGGMASDQSSTLVVGCAFSGNVANLGGGMHNTNGSALTVTRCQFLGNIAAGGGGGMANITVSSPFIINCWFRDNTAGGVGGGGILNVQSDAALVGCELAGNAAASGGGMCNLAGGSLIVAGCTIAGNAATGAGGGIWFDTGSPSLGNSILWDNSDAGGIGESAQLGEGAGTPLVSYCCIQGLTGGFGGAGNIADDPMFANPFTGDHRLLPGSPCIDAGHNWLVPADAEDLDGDGDTGELTPLDLDDNPRFSAVQTGGDPGCGVPAVVEMGAFELQGNPAGEVRLGDLDGDGSVSVVDFLALLSAWGRCADGCCLPDLDLDGAVGLADFLALLGSWTAGP